MLQHEPQEHEPQEHAAPTPAAQIRVTPEELAQALNFLEASKDEAARHLAGTVPIGEVVQEMKLEATPEEIWAQVQRQRAQAAQEEAARVRPAAVPVFPAAQDVRMRQRARGWRRLGRGWQGMKGWLWIIFWCSGGMGLISTALHPSHTAHGAQERGITGDNLTQTTRTLGKPVEVTGDNDTITLQGNCPTLTITGDGDHIRVEGTVGRVIVAGDHNTIVYTQGTAPALSGNGDGNHVGPSAP